MGLEAVIFDMDGVLIDTTEYHYLSWKKVAERLGIPFTHSDNDRLRRLSRQESLHVLLGGKQVSDDLIHELLEYKNSCFMNYIEQVEMHELLPGVFALLWELHAAQVPVGVSSSSRNARLIVSRLGINHHIEAICDASNVEKRKPHPDVFLCAASLLEVKPENCMVIEEGAAGVQTGLSAGMCVVGVGAGPLTHEAYTTVPSLENVRLIDLQEIYTAWHAEMMTGESQVMQQPGFD
jgi:beta-phosphoglucomutase